MQPITYYVQTPAIDRLVAQYGDRLELMSTEDRLSFLGVLVRSLRPTDFYEREGTDTAIHAWHIVSQETDLTVISLVEAIAPQIYNDLRSKAIDTQLDSPNP